MKKFLLTSLLLVLAAACARGPLKRVNYAEGGVGFTYLSDWRVKSDKIVNEATGARVITLEGPHGAMLSITRFPTTAPITLDEYAAMIEQKRDAAVGKVSGGLLHSDDSKTVHGGAQTKIAGQAREGLSQVFQLNVVGISTNFRADFYMIEDENFKWVLMAQQPVSRQSAIDPEMQLIYDSLLLGSAQPQQQAGAPSEKK